MKTTQGQQGAGKRSTLNTQGATAKGDEGIMRWGFVACVAAICWALGSWEMDEEAAYAAEEAAGRKVEAQSGPDYAAPCPFCGRRIKWVPLPCECCWPPVEMDTNTWAGVRE